MGGTQLADRHDGAGDVGQGTRVKRLHRSEATTTEDGMRRAVEEEMTAPSSWMVDYHKILEPGVIRRDVVDDDRAEALRRGVAREILEVIGRKVGHRIIDVLYLMGISRRTTSPAGIRLHILERTAGSRGRVFSGSPAGEARDVGEGRG